MIKNLDKTKQTFCTSFLKLSPSHTRLAETVVVKETQLSTNVSGVVPVISSHWAGAVPPGRRDRGKKVISVNLTAVSAESQGKLQ